MEAACDHSISLMSMMIEIKMQGVWVRLGIRNK